MLRTTVHMLLHLLVPALIARLASPRHPARAWILMVSTLAIDLDHLLAEPVFDAHRCSIGFHPLHTWPAMVGYALLVAMPRTRWVGVGLIVHLVLDGIDCYWMAVAG